MCGRRLIDKSFSSYVIDRRAVRQPKARGKCRPRRGRPEPPRANAAGSRRPGLQCFPIATGQWRRIDRPAPRDDHCAGPHLVGCRAHAGLREVALRDCRRAIGGAFFRSSATRGKQFKAGLIRMASSSPLQKGVLLINAQMSGFAGEAEILCSTRALPVLTPSGLRSRDRTSPRAPDRAALHHPSGRGHPLRRYVMAHCLRCEARQDVLCR